jgi:hypothetical protein
MIEVEPIVSNATAYNVAVRAGSGTGVGSFAPAVWENTNPSDPMSLTNGYPPSVDFQTSSLYATQAQAQVAADAAGLVDMGAAESMVVTSIVVPDVDVDSVATVGRVRAGIAPNTLVVVDSFILGLGVNATLQATCRLVYPI